MKRNFFFYLMAVLFSSSLLSNSYAEIYGQGLERTYKPEKGSVVEIVGIEREIVPQRIEKITVPDEVEELTGRLKDLPVINKLLSYENPKVDIMKEKMTYHGSYQDWAERSQHEIRQGYFTGFGVKEFF